MIPRRFLDHWKGNPAKLHIEYCNSGNPLLELEMVDTDKPSSICFVIKNLRQGRQIVKALTAALDEWKDNG